MGLLIHSFNTRSESSLHCVLETKTKSISLAECCTVGKWSEVQWLKVLRVVSGWHNLTVYAFFHFVTVDNNNVYIWTVLPYSFKKYFHMPPWNYNQGWIHITKIFYLQKLSIRSPEGELKQATQIGQSSRARNHQGWGSQLMVIKPCMWGQWWHKCFFRDTSWQISTSGEWRVY